MTRPFGYFLHHQGRGHAERCAAILHALPASRPATVFCARPEMLDGLLPDRARIVPIPSLFEPRGDERPADWIATPDTLHCAPVGWPGIRAAMGTLAGWFAEADPALIVCDVSAEVAQLARICSVPHVKVLQHGDRGDAGHRAAYDGAAGLIVPCDERLAQADWTPAMRAKSVFAGGLGVDTAMPARADARRALGLDPSEEIVVVLSGGGGGGFAGAPLGVGARATPRARWITLGQVARDWHATEPANLEHRGWVDDVPRWLAAADLVVASTGNTTCQQILAAGVPWLAVPEWRYFDEQVEKARALQAAGAVHHVPHLPSSAHAWRAALDAARATHDPILQTSMVRPDAAAHVAGWLEELAERLDAPTPQRPEPAMTDRLPPTPASVLTLARGREAHLRNVILGLMRQHHRPKELVIGVMQDEPYEDLPETSFPIRQIHVTDHELPLARARNTVANAAEGDVLIFLDVDCIPHPDLVGDYVKGTRKGDGLTMGEVLYLPAGAARDGWTYDHFEKVAVRHSDRQGPPATARKRCEDYRCFWSLTFAMHRDDWAATGGFDERFVGYGGEDTDFGKSLDAKGIPIWWLRGARSFHQHHTHCMPPIHHVASILRNTEIFAEKWGHRTMEHWLHGFAMMGLIENTRSGLRILREPNEADYALCAQRPDMPYAATGPVIRRLEDARAAADGVRRTYASADERHAAMVAEQERLLEPAPRLAAE
ncbi:glycosyltransferase [Jannaschia sp. LMIT008]|uniref:glycosyltransferase n=1 Tax=Jannaschia maritima TaxID=3032585 RepID=UPI0028110096|nr:galactosyltransferase-related protein [Jannaschia sp. LMIT008]